MKMLKQINFHETDKYLTSLKRIHSMIFSDFLLTVKVRHLMGCLFYYVEPGLVGVTHLELLPMSYAI